MEGCKKPNYSEGKLPMDGKQHRVLLTGVLLTEVSFRRTGSRDVRIYPSNWFYVVPVDSHGHRSLDRIDGNDQAVIAVLRQKHAFDSIHRAAAYSDPLPHFEKGIGTPGC